MESNRTCPANTTIIDNRDGNTLLAAVQRLGEGGARLDISSAFFSIDALLVLADTLAGYQRIRILFGDDASAVQRKRLLEMLRTRSDADLLAQRESHPTLSPLKAVAKLFEEGRIEARCYTVRKFHAKAYLIHRDATYPPRLGVIGSGNFTRPGLTQNVELNVELYKEQVDDLNAWFEERWAEAQADVVTEDLLNEVHRQIELYDPYILYLKALTLWGSQQQIDRSALDGSPILDALDPHQEQGFRRALKIIEQHYGCMVCDGVGLGKSFIALALMDRFCREGKNVLLVAPKNILTSSWQSYLERYLDEFLDGWGGLRVIAMTDLGFPPEEKSKEDADPPSEATLRKRKQVARWWRSADLVVIDESHNFRTSAANRYLNLYKIMAPGPGGRKRTLLLTATPLNTEYRDIANQLALITHERGNIAGYGVRAIRAYADQLDRTRSVDTQSLQLGLGLMETPSEAFNRILESVVIQRSRATVRELAAAVGKEVLFPKRNDPCTIQVKIGPESRRYAELVKLAERRFQPTAEYIRQLRAEIEKAEKQGAQVSPKLRKGPQKGIKLAAFLTEQYRKEPAKGRKTYLDEVQLAGLVFVNTLKQLESSPVAFQGILQSLGIGLIARLRHVFGEDAQATVDEHAAWLQRTLFGASAGRPEDSDQEEDEEGLRADGASLDASGDEADDWIAKAISQRGLQKKLRDFTEDAYDIHRWRRDIESDLRFLREIHEAALRAREQPDPKLEQVLPTIRSASAGGRKLLVFTQSQRTAEYLERELRVRLPGVPMARIDSRVEETRAAILHAFCPNYNPPPLRKSPSVPDTLDILISTDVLSEGVNLQDASAILSYDIHWNPVRLIQRIGRVDRRIDPAKTSRDHAFDIYNVLPAEEINDIIHLVGTVEERTLRISNALGLDASFFKSTDPAGNLKEFNKICEGDVSVTDRALNAFAGLLAHPPDARTEAVLDALPAGAFGVWSCAPFDGLFALFTLEARPTAPESDRQTFASLIGKPILAMERDGEPITFDAGRILAALSATTSGQASGVPSDEAALAARLKRLRDEVRRSFADIGLPATIAPRLVCWMELRRT